MSLTKEEIIWLAENYAMMKPEKKNCGCGQDPCKTYGPQETDFNVTISGKPDHEIEMAHKQLHKAADYAQKLADVFHNMDETNLPAWVQAKITKLSDYMSTVYHYLQDDIAPQNQMMNEKAEGNIRKAKHEVEVDVNISKSDMKKLHDGEKVVLKDKTGSNTFTITVSAS